MQVSPDLRFVKVSLWWSGNADGPPDEEILVPVQPEGIKGAATFVQEFIRVHAEGECPCTK